MKSLNPRSSERLPNIGQLIFTVVCVVVSLTSCTNGADSYSPKSTNVPTVTLTTTSPSIAYDTSTGITWTSTNSISCSSFPSGLNGTSGNYTTPKLTGTTTYSITCLGTGGQAVASVKITVIPTTITKFADSLDGQHVTVTSANNLSNGAIISISGTNNYNGGPYTITNVTPQVSIL